MVFLLWAMDMVGLGAAFGLAYGLRSLAGNSFTEPLYPFAEYLPLMVFSALLVSVTFLSTGRYKSQKLKKPKSFASGLQRTGTVALLLLASSYLGHQEVVSRAVLLVFVLLLGIFSDLGEALLRKILLRLEKGNLSLERTVLVGSPNEVQAWLAGARNLASQGIDIAGYVADPEADAPGLPALGGGTLPWLGRQNEIMEVVTRYRISQVVFWQRPLPGSGMYAVLARLRRLRIRLRWQVEDVWLLQARARAEEFGGAPSAVQDGDSVSMLRMAVSRSGAFCMGLGLGFFGFIPWLGLQFLGKPKGWAHEKLLLTHDLWGHDPVVKLMVGRSGKTLPLIWQFPLAGLLLGGRLVVWGGHAAAGVPATEPVDYVAAGTFWSLRPDLPGLTGSWAKDGENFLAPLKSLWNDPGGF